jgi:hypothetical protein
MSLIEVTHPSEVETVLASGAWLPAPLPTPTPATGTVDLVASARTTTGDTVDGVKWIQGFTVVGDACGPLIALDPCDMTPDPQTFSGLSSYAVLPYVLTAGVQCSTFGATPDSLLTSARRLLNSGAASAAIERQVWGGDPALQAVGVNPSFRSAGQAVAGAARAPVPALAELEHVARVKAPGLGRYMIHASPRVVSLWSSTASLRKVGNTLLTNLDTVIVAGAGYPTANGPGGAAAAAGSEWAFITGIVSVNLSDVLPTEEPALLVDRTKNITVATASRFAAATWAPCLPPQGALVTVT